MEIGITDMQLEFTKMHGCGNDYIYINCFGDNPILSMSQDGEKLSRTIAALSDRHFSIGGDGLIMICPSLVADCKMRMFNADGSEGRMCGNAIRCVGKFVYDKGIVKKDVITVETLSGIKTLYMQIENGVAVAVKADLGKAVFEKEAVPVVWDSEGCISVPLTVEDREFVCNAVSMGSAHCVCFVEDVQGFPLEVYGKAMEVHKAFPDRVNAEFIRLIDSHTVEMRVWERGSGETWACGTGACASAAVCVKLGLCPANEDITVRLKGGELVINVSEERVFMQGPAKIAYEGCIEL